MSSRRGGRPPNTAARPYQPPAAPEKTRRTPDQIKDPGLRAVAQRLDGVRRELEAAQAAEKAARRARVAEILAAKTALQNLAVETDDQTQVEEFIGEFVDLSAGRVHQLLNPKPKPPTNTVGD